MSLDRSDSRPLHDQIETTIRAAIRSGELAAGDSLASSRALAAELGVSRGVVTNAYGQLSAEGYLVTKQGAPVRVASGRRVQPQPAALPSLVEHFPYDFSPGLPDLAGFPRDRWLQSMRRAWRETPIEAIGTADPRGVPALREALAHHLTGVRGATADPEQILVCSGFRQGLSLLCRWLAQNGIEHVALEDPGWHAQRLIVEQAGLTAIPIPVDEEGIDVAALSATQAEAVVVTPAHQFPTGPVLSAARRTALIEWADRGDNLIIEDDYDGELCPGRVGALQGLAPDRVLYVGSASKRLTPGLGIGWMILPSWLSWPLTTAKSIEDGGGDITTQLAFADFIARGEFARHLRRMRAQYAHRHTALVAALAAMLPAWTARSTGGLYTLVKPPLGTDEPIVVGAAARAGVGVEGLSLHSYRGDAPPGLVLGHAHLPEPAITRGIALLAQSLTAASWRSHDVARRRGAAQPDAHGSAVAPRTPTLASSVNESPRQTHNMYNGTQ